jgi:hypothetical protein
MSISYAEHVSVTCPKCQTPFIAETFIVVDAGERPDLVARILDDTLHDSRCPQCGQVGRVPAPMLYHDGQRQQVLLAVPPGMTEAAWREAGQGLLWMLIGALPEDQRLPYLGDVQAEGGLAGVAHVIRQGRAVEPTDDDAEEAPPIVFAIQALLQAKSSQELLQALDQHPILDDPQAVMIMRELAVEARRTGEIEAANGFGRAADLLQQVKDMRAALPASSAAGLSPEQVEEWAFALLRSTSGQELASVVDEHPALLDETTDAVLVEYIAQARRENKQRIAEGLEERLYAVREMRAQYRQQQPILDAVQAYLQAETNDEIEVIVLEREELTSDAADEALERLANSARADGDMVFAAFVEERRTFLRQVRAALEE